MRARARELFSCALETPGGLKVQTIHALCTRLLQQFPFEANVPARFAVLDDRDQFEIMERSILAVLLDAAAKPQSDIGKALADGHHELRRQDVSRRRAGSLPRQQRLPAMDRRQCRPGAGAAPYATLGLQWRRATPGDRAGDHRRTASAAHAGGRRSRQCWTDGSENDQKQANTLRAAHALAGAAQVEEYLSLFLTQAKDFRKSFVTQRIAGEHPDVAAAFDR